MVIQNPKLLQTSPEQSTQTLATQNHETLAPMKPQPTPDSDSVRLIGTWQADVFELGYRVRINWQLNEDGTLYYRFDFTNGSYTESYGTWTYSNGILFEQIPNQAPIRGAIKWINDNHFELTIIDNGIPAYTGMKRNYYRQF